MSALHVGPESSETEKERVDRELREMLEEIRVALPGIQLLLGFLLIVPFSVGFDTLDTLQRDLFLTCFVLTAATIALLVAPTAAHRMGFRRVDKLALLIRTNRQIIAALLLFGIALSLAAYLVSSMILASSLAALIAAALALWFALWWFVVPKLAHWRSPSRGRPASPSAPDRADEIVHA